MIVLGVTTVVLVANGFAADANAPANKIVKLKGIVSVTKDANNVVTSVKLTTSTKVVYNVTLDKKGEELAGHNGKEVEADCVITEKNGQKWAQVQEFKIVEKKKEMTPLTTTKKHKK
jgi:type II secretory pathway component PulC